MKSVTGILCAVVVVLLGVAVYSFAAPDIADESLHPATHIEPQAEPPGTADDTQSTASVTTLAPSAPQTTTTTVSTVKDTTPPQVSGNNFEITVGDSVSYKKQITVTDDYDAAPVIEVDNSAVDLDTPGEYPVVYEVTDSAGNTTKLTLILTVKKLVPDKAATEEYVLYQARQILAEITDDSMSKLQVAYAIYRWSKYNIAYTSTSDKTNWVIGAYNAFNKRSGDCYSYFAASKALFTAAGIENIDLERAPSYDGSRHFWSLVNVGDGWYHFDSTPFRTKNANFFMLTDDEIHTWDNMYYYGEHDYFQTDLPEFATQSIQSKVDYSSNTLKE